MMKMIVSWLGRKMNRSEMEDGKWNLYDLLDQPCMVLVRHDIGKKDGKIYANVQSVTPLPKGLECPKRWNNVEWFFMGFKGLAEQFDQGVFDSFPDYLKQKIASTQEYNAVHQAEDQAVKEAEAIFAIE